MRVLWLCSYPPYPPDFGGARRTYHLLEQATRAGHEVDLLAFALGDAPRDAEAVAALRRLCRHVELVADPWALPAALGAADPAAVSRKRRGQLRSLLSRRPYQFHAHYSARMQAALDRRAASGRYDLAQVEFSQMAYYRLPAGAATVLDLHNVEYEVLGRVAHAGGAPVRRLYNWAEYVKFRRAEPRLWRRFGRLLVTSDRDAALVRRRWPTAPVTVAPNGVDTAYFMPPPPGLGPAPDAAPHLVFTGMMAYYPNTDAALWFADAIWPLIHREAPDARWTIVGAEPPPQVRALGDRAGITVLGRVDDVRPPIWGSHVSVVPLRSGGGTRLKIVEALAMAQPIVSTTVGCEGIAAEPGSDLLIADEPAAFAAAVLRLLRDPARGAALGQAGRALAERRYSWPVVAAPMLDVWAALAGRVPLTV
jgi:polysaccharide biosynthesis protein PslH